MVFIFFKELTACFLTLSSYTSSQSESVEPRVGEALERRPTSQLQQCNTFSSCVSMMNTVCCGVKKQKLNTGGNTVYANGGTSPTAVNGVCGAAVCSTCGCPAGCLAHSPSPSLRHSPNQFHSECGIQAAPADGNGMMSMCNGYAAHSASPLLPPAASASSTLSLPALPAASALNSKSLSGTSTSTSLVCTCNCHQQQCCAASNGSITNGNANGNHYPNGNGLSAAAACGASSASSASSPSSISSTASSCFSSNCVGCLALPIGLALGVQTNDSSAPASPGGRVACREMCFFCFDVLHAYLYNLPPPPDPLFTNSD